MLDQVYPVIIATGTRVTGKAIALAVGHAIEWVHNHPSTISRIRQMCYGYRADGTFIEPGANDSALILVTIEDARVSVE